MTGPYSIRHGIGRLVDSALKRRALTSKLRALAATFPVVCLGGPRQSGKATLARAVFACHPCVSLEDPDHLEFATEDPRGFLARYSSGAVLDEIQRVKPWYASS